MSPKEKPFADLVLPLTLGGVELADVSAFHGISFAVRGEGSYQLLLENYAIDRANWFSSTFDGAEKWKTVKLPFTAFRSKNSALPLPLHTLRALHFELAAPAGSDAWLDIDDVKFY